MHSNPRFSGGPALRDAPVPVRSSSRDTVRLRSLLRLVQGLNAGATLSASAVAALVGKNGYDLVKQAAECTQSTPLSMNDRLQAHLRNVVQVLHLAFLVHGDFARALHWYRNGAVAEQGDRTPEWCTSHGGAEALCRALEDRHRCRAAQP